MSPNYHNLLIRFDNSLTIRNASTIVGKLMGALSPQMRVELDCAENAEIDLWFVQLLVAASKGVRRQAGELVLSARLTESLADILRAGGFSTPFPPQSATHG